MRMDHDDRSRKGSVDAAILPLVDALNAHTSYYTTSSCSGRIRILGQEFPIKKNKTVWLFTSHDPLDAAQREDMHRIVFSLPTLVAPSCEYWFMQESAIIHVACETLSAAQQLLVQARACGFKRSGLQSVSGRLIVELVNINRMETIIALRGRVLIDGAYLDALIDKANAKLLINFEKINTLAAHIANS